MDVVRQLGPQVPLLGVCLGHQCIGEALGATVTGARSVMHGKTSLVHHDGRGVFHGLKQSLSVTRYHSLAVSPIDLPPELEISAWTTDSSGAPLEIMGLRHRHWPVEGVQFHPEAILTEFGHEMLANFLSMARCFPVASFDPRPSMNEKIR
jgi:anthranilate synthase component 2